MLVTQTQLFILADWYLTIAWWSSWLKVAWRHVCRSQAKAACCTIAYHRCIHCVIIIIDHNGSYFGEELRVCGKRSYLISHAHHFYSVIPHSAFYRHPICTLKNVTCTVPWKSVTWKVPKLCALLIYLSNKCNVLDVFWSECAHLYELLQVTYRMHGNELPFVHSLRWKTPSYDCIPIGKKSFLLW